MRRLLRLLMPLFAALAGLLAVSAAGAANPWQARGPVLYSMPGYTTPPAVAPRKAKRPRADRHRAASRRVALYRGEIGHRGKPGYRAKVSYREKTARRLAARPSAGRMTARAGQRKTDTTAVPVPRIAALGDRAMPQVHRPISSSGGVEARIDLRTQKMVVKVDGEVAHVWKVSTARKGYVTPRGVYGPQRMHKSYFSKKYYNSPMPYSIFFKGGYAVHGTTAVKALGGPASHGCIRLATANARALFNLVKSYGPKHSRIIIS